MAPLRLIPRRSTLRKSPCSDSWNDSRVRPSPSSLGDKLQWLALVAPASLKIVESVVDQFLSQLKQ